ATGPRGLAAQVVRVLSRPVDEVCGVEGEGELRGIGLTQKNRSGRTYARHDGGVARGKVILAAKRSARRDDASGVERILDRHGHTMERAFGLALGEQGVGFAGLG